MVYLVPISDESFEIYRTRSIREYARVQVEAGIWPEAEALKLSEREHARLLPDGAATRDHFVFSVEEVTTGDKVGVAWLAILEKNGPREAYIYDIQIEEASRSRGYGSMTMRLLEDKARDMGVKTIRLRVHAHNRRAHALYRRLGYEETDIMMVRRFDDGGTDGTA